MRTSMYAMLLASASRQRAVLTLGMALQAMTTRYRSKGTVGQSPMLCAYAHRGTQLGSIGATC